MLSTLLFIVFPIIILGYFSTRRVEIPNNYGIYERKKNFLYIVCVSILILYSGLRDPFLYPDIANYLSYFKGHFDDASEGSLNIGFISYNVVIRYLFDNFSFYCFVTSFLVVFAYSKIIINWSPYIWLSILLYIFVNYFPSFFLLKQYLATIFIFLAFNCVINNRKKWFYVFIILAISVHSTAFIALPMFLLYNIKINKRNLILILLSSVLLCVFLTSVGEYLLSFSLYYSRYSSMMQTEPAWQRAIMKVFIFVVFLYAGGQKVFSQGVPKLIFYCMLINVIICVGAANVYGVFRLRDYFSIADIIGVPLILQFGSKTSGVKKIVVFASTLLYIYLLYLSYNTFINNSDMNNAYKLIWNSAQFNQL